MAKATSPKLQGQQRGLTVRAQEVRLRFDDMPESLQKVATSIRDLFSECDCDVLHRYDIGKLITDVMNDNTNKYGDGAVKKLAKVLGRTEATLYHYAEVAETWTRPAMEKLVKKRDAAQGSRLSWSHFVALASVAETRDRNKLIKLWEDSYMPVAELRDIIRPRLSGLAGTTMPVTIKSGLREISGQTDMLHSRMELWNSHIFEAFDRDVDLQGDEAEEVLEKALESSKSLLKGAEDLVERLKKTKTKLKRRKSGKSVQAA